MKTSLPLILIRLCHQNSVTYLTFRIVVGWMTLFSWKSLASIETRIISSFLAAIQFLLLFSSLASHSFISCLTTNWLRTTKYDLNKNYEKQGGRESEKWMYKYERQRFYFILETISSPRKQLWFAFYFGELIHNIEKLLNWN